MIDNRRGNNPFPRLCRYWRSIGKWSSASNSVRTIRSYLKCVIAVTATGEKDG